MTPGVPTSFSDDLLDVTEEIVKEQACQTVLDQVAPAPDEPGEHKAWTDPVQEVVDRMIERRWNPPGPDRWGRFVAWQTYVTGIVQDADQLANALVADPSQTTLFLRPPVQRAAMAYARFCYPTPKTP